MFRIDAIKKSKYPRLSIISVLLFIYIVFTELLLPTNYFLPKPTLIILSLLDIISHYSVISALLDTFIVVFASISFVYFGFKIYGVWLCRLYMFIPSVRKLDVIVKYIPALLFASIFVLVFSHDYAGEFLLISTYAFFKMTSILFNYLEEFPQEYLDQYIVLKIEWWRFVRQVLWKGCLVGIKKNLSVIVFTMWSLAIIYEYMGKSFGIGSVINKLIINKDFYGILALIIISGILYFVIEKIISMIVNKTTFWKR